MSGDDVRVLATAGAFRVVSAGGLREPNSRTPTRSARESNGWNTPACADRRMSSAVRERRLVMLTGEGRTLLDLSPTPRCRGERQAFYAGITKPRELAHDSRLLSRYMKAAERLV